MVNEIIEHLVTNKNREVHFVGHVLQGVRIRECKDIPTAGVMLNKKTGLVSLVYNPEFFARLTFKQQVAVFVHEIEHITHGHLTRRFPENWNRQVLNIAMDIVINQNIKNLPKEACTAKKFKLPLGQTTEEYYKLLMQDPKMQQTGGEGQGFDKHDWDNCTPEEKANAVNNLLQRAESRSRSGVPEHVRDTMQDLQETLRQKTVPWDVILKQSVKKCLTAFKKQRTWKRVSRRYGLDAKGLQKIPTPKINFLVDTSGSIVYETITQVYEALSEFFREGHGSKATLGLFHTELYHTQVIKKGFDVASIPLESGGTTLEPAFREIHKSGDLTIVLTDGYYEDFPAFLKGHEAVFVITDHGTKEHPLHATHKTVEMKG